MNHESQSPMKLNELFLYDIGNNIQMVGVVYAGGGTTYIVPLPEDRGLNLDKFEILDMDMDDWKKFLRQTDIVEAELVTKDDRGNIVKAIIRKSARAVETGVAWNVYRRDNYTCRYCGDNKCPLTVDHLICVEFGGPSIEDNLVAACRKCNKVRGNLRYSEWLEHPRYRDVSRKLTQVQRDTNTAVLDKLGRIPLLTK